MSDAERLPPRSASDSGSCSSELGPADEDTLGVLAQELVYGPAELPNPRELADGPKHLSERQRLIDETNALISAGVAKQVAVSQVVAHNTRGMAWNAIIGESAAHFNLSDLYVLEFVFSTLAALPIPGDPIWGFIVGPPAGLKTEVLRWLNGLPAVYTTSRLTPHSLVSGLKDGQSLLPKLDGKTLVIKDFTTILEMDRKAREEIFAQLRDAFDGYYEGFYGSVGQVSYEAHFNVLAAVTPAIEEYYSVQSFLGPRFVKVRSPLCDGFDRSLKDTGDEPAIRDWLSKLARRLTDSIPPDAWRGVDASRLPRIRPIVEALAVGRTHIMRTEGAIAQVPEPEGVPRLAKQFKKLAIGRALLYGRTEIDDSDLGFLRRVAIDTLPSVRSRILTALLTPGTVNNLSEEVRLPSRTIYRHLEDLEALGLVVSDGENSPRPRTFWLDSRALHLVTPHTDGETAGDSAKEVGGGEGVP